MADSLNEKYKVGSAFYFKDENGNEVATDLEGYNQHKAAGHEQIVPSYYADKNGNEYAVTGTTAQEFAENNLREGREVKPMITFDTQNGQPIGGSAIRVSPYDTERLETLRGMGYTNSADTGDARVGLGDVVKEMGTSDYWKNLPENLVRGVEGVTTESMIKAAQTVGDAVLAGGAFVADATGDTKIASTMRGWKRGLDTGMDKLTDANIKGVLGDAFYNEGDDSKKILKQSLEVAGTVGSVATLGAGVAAAGAKGAALMAATFGAEGYEDTLSKTEAAGKDPYTWEAQLAAGLNGAVQAGTSLLYGKLAKILPGAEAKRVIMQTYGRQLQAALLDTVEGGALGSAQGAVADITDAIAQGKKINWGELGRRMITNFWVGSATIGVTKLPAAVGAAQAQARATYCQNATRQGIDALRMVQNGMPVAQNRKNLPDVKAVTVNGEVLFNDGSVFRPVMNGKQVVEMQVITADGTILNSAGKVTGKTSGMLGPNGLKGNSQTAAEFFFRSTDAESPSTWRIIDPTTGETTDGAAMLETVMPESVKNYRAWQEGGQKGPAPALDADGYGYLSLWQDALNKYDGQISRLAQLAIEQVNTGKLSWSRAAELAENAYHSTGGRGSSLYGKFDLHQRSAAPEGRGNQEQTVDAEGRTVEPAHEIGMNADGPVVSSSEIVPTDLPPVGPTEGAAREGGAVPEITVQNAGDLATMISDGTIAPTTVDAGEIATPQGGSDRPQEPLVLVQRTEENGGALEVVSGQVPQGAKQVNAVVVNETDGWTGDAEKALAYQIGFRYATLTPAEQVQAEAKLGLVPKNISPSPYMVEKINDQNYPAMKGISSYVNMKMMGMGWQEAQQKLIETMPAHADRGLAENAAKLVCFNPNITGEKSWELAQWIYDNDDGSTVELAEISADPEAIERKMAEQQVSTVPVEKTDGSMTTVGEELREIAAPQGEEIAAPQGGSDRPELDDIYAVTVDHSLDMTPMQGKTGVWNTPRFPEVTIRVAEDAEGKFYQVEGLTPQMMLDARNRADMGAFLAMLEERAKAAGVDIDFGTEDNLMIANELVLNHEDTSRENRITKRQERVLHTVEQSGLAEKIYTSEEDFSAALAKFPEAQKMQTEGGGVYGFYLPGSGKIYLNGAAKGTAIGTGTLFHELAHPFAARIRKANPEAYARIVELAKALPLFEELKNSKEYGKLSDAKIAEEVLARVVEKRYRDFGENADLAKIYEDIDKLVRAFAEAVGADLGVRNLSPAAIMNWSLEDFADAMVEEELSGKRVGGEPLDALEGHLKSLAKRYHGYPDKNTKQAKAAMSEIKKIWMGLNEQQKAALTSHGEKSLLNADYTAFGDTFRSLAKWDQWRANIAERAKYNARHNPTAAQKEMISRGRENYVAKGEDNPGSPYSWLVGNGRKGIANYPINKSDELYDWWTHFTNGMKSKEKHDWARLLFGTDYVNNKGKGNDLLIRNYRNWVAGGDSGWNAATEELEQLRPEDLMDQVIAGEENYRVWREGDRLSDEERHLKEEYEDYLAEVFPEGEDAMGERAQLEEQGWQATERHENERMGQWDKEPEAEFSIGKLYTGSAANYATRMKNGRIKNPPRLVHVGSGEGSQVYGWGLYASNQRGVAENYARGGLGEAAFKVAGKIHHTRPDGNGKTVEDVVARQIAYVYQDGDKPTREKVLNHILKDRDSRITQMGEQIAEFGKASKTVIDWINELNEAKKYIEAHEDMEIIPMGKVYEQTWFTNREPGDESHLLNWYEPVSKENLKRILDEAIKEKIGTRDPREPEVYILGGHDIASSMKGNGPSAQVLYKEISRDLGTPKAASEFLARADIDGIKYPVDSYGGKGIKDGDRAGWNYVSFRDDNIHVDHKWVNGEPEFSRSIGGSGRKIVGGKGPATVSPEQDAAYLEAVKRGDMDVAQRMVREAAVKEMPNTKVVDKDGLPLVVYHGTDADFTKFDPKRSGERSNEDWGPGIYLTADHGAANHYAHEAYLAHGKAMTKEDALWYNSKYEDWASGRLTPQEHKRFEELRDRKNKIRFSGDVLSDDDTPYGKVMHLFVNIQNPKYHTVVDGVTDSHLAEQAKKEGYDGLIIDGGDEIVAFYPEQVKQVDVTYDDNGNVIPLSQRFDQSNPDIRFSQGLSGRGGRTHFVAGRARVADDAGRGENVPGVFAASTELNRTQPTPISMAGTVRKISLPLSELEWLRKKLTGDLGAALVKRGATTPTAKHLAVDADVFGIVDKTDMDAQKTTLRQHGFFRNEDPNWCLMHGKNDIAAEQERSEQALATGLLDLGQRRVNGTAIGGQGAARSIFADQLAQLIMKLPSGAPGQAGRVQKIGAALIRNTSAATITEGDAFLDWAYGPRPVDPQTQQPVPRTIEERAAAMLGAWLVMPETVTRMAPSWDRAILDTITSDPKLVDAWQELSVRSMSPLASDFVMDQIQKAMTREHDQLAAQLKAEANTPITARKTGNRVKEGVIVALHDRMAPVVIRTDEMTQNYCKWAKDAIKMAPDKATRQMLEQQLDQFLHGQLTARKRFELARTAYERGTANVDRRYFMEMLMLVNEATERWGLDLGDVSKYMFLNRVIETQGRATALGISPRQAQVQLGEMNRRLTPERWARLGEFTQRFHATIEREILNNPDTVEMFGSDVVDYMKRFTHYVTMKQTLSQEQLEELQQRFANTGIDPTDDIYGMMAKMGKRIGTGADGDEFTAMLKGSMGPKAETIGATLEKHGTMMHTVHRNHLVIAMKDFLVGSGVDGVKVLPRGSYPESKRYGFINYVEGGKKKTLQVPKDVADGFKHDGWDNSFCNFLQTVNTFTRSCLIDWNPGYWNNNINRNLSSIEHNMPGMHETWLKTVTRPLGLSNTTDVLLQHLVRHSGKAQKAVTWLFGKDTPIAYVEEAKRLANLLEDPGTWQKERWAAEDAGDLGKVQRMDQDLATAMEMLKGNMFTGGFRPSQVGESEGLMNDVFKQQNMKTLQQMQREIAAKSTARKALDKANIFLKNQQQQNWEDVFAKTIAYLHDRATFGTLQARQNGEYRTPEESGQVVGDNVSIARAERKGFAAKPIQLFFQQFYNTVEKGTVRFYKRHFQKDPFAGDNRWESWRKTSSTFLGRAMFTALGQGLLQAGLIAIAGDEKKAKERFGKLYDFAAFWHNAYTTCSDYFKHNYGGIPFWRSKSGDTSAWLAIAQSDEDKIIGGVSDLCVDKLAEKVGTGRRVDTMGRVWKLATQGVTPDLQASSPFFTLFKGTITATQTNPYDAFRGANIFDSDTFELRNEKPGDYLLAMGQNLWNSLGGNMVVTPDRTNINEGADEVPRWAQIARKIPFLGSAAGRYLKIQTASPAKRFGMVGDELRRFNSLDKVSVKEFIADMKAHDGKAMFDRDPKAYDQWIDKLGRYYDNADVAELLREKVDAHCQQAAINAQDPEASRYDELNKLYKQAEKMGLDDVVDRIVNEL